MTQRWGWVTTGWKMTSHCVERIFQEIQSFQPPADQSKQCPCTFYCVTFFFPFFFNSWLLILPFPALYALPASAIKGLHGGGWDVPGRGDQGDQPDQGPQAAPHAPVPRVDGSYPSILSSCTSKSGPGTRTKHELLMSIYSFFFFLKNWKSHYCLRLRDMLP